MSDASLSSLGDLQQLVMLAVARLGDEAYGNAIRQELADVAGRRVAVSTVYVTLVRLEDNGLVSSKQAEPEPGAGGRGRRYFRVAPEGWAALHASREMHDRMWAGVAEPT